MNFRIQQEAGERGGRRVAPERRKVIGTLKVIGTHWVELNEVVHSSLTEVQR